ncbi:hypothetical protein DL765_002185 [Monosporascus sp. GIB2]|nr:hypothetical protein DL765_002185 [Monosporascus sp. GIB2]
MATDAGNGDQGPGVVSKFTVLCLLDRELPNGFIEEWEVRVPVKIYLATFENPADPAQLLRDHPSPRAIFIGSAPEEMRRHQDISSRIAEYARGGGTVLLTMDRMDSRNRRAFQEWMRDTWGLTWEYADLSLGRFYLVRHDPVFFPSQMQWKTSVACAGFGQGLLGWIGDIGLPFDNLAISFSVFTMMGLSLDMR